MQHYVILSEGEYSSYFPKYFVGQSEISQEQLDKKGREVGDALIEEFDNLPTRPHEKPSYHTCFGDCPATDKFWPETNKTASSYDLSEIWFTRMSDWLAEASFTQLPENIPEINVSYSEIPTSKNQ